MELPIPALFSSSSDVSTSWCSWAIAKMPTVQQLSNRSQVSMKVFTLGMVFQRAFTPKQPRFWRRVSTMDPVYVNVMISVPHGEPLHPCFTRIFAAEDGNAMEIATGTYASRHGFREWLEPRLSKTLLPYLPWK